MQALTQILGAITAGQAAVNTKLGVISSVHGTNNLIKKVTVVPPTGFSTVTGDNTNAPTISVGYRRAAGSRVVIATLDLLTGTNLVADTPLAIPVTSATVQPSSLRPGDVIDVQLAQRGTGAAIGTGLLAQVEIR